MGRHSDEERADALELVGALEGLEDDETEDDEA